MKLIKLFVLLFFVFTNLNSWAQKKPLPPYERLAQKIFALEYHYYPSYDIDRLLDGATNVQIASIHGVSLNYTSRFSFENRRHFIDLSFSLSFYRTGVNAYRVEEKFPAPLLSIIRPALGFSLTHNTYFLKKEKSQCFISYGMKVIYMPVEGSASSVSSWINEDGSEGQVLLDATFLGGTNRQFQYRHIPFVPMLHAGIGIELPHKKRFDLGWIFEFHFSFDFPDHPMSTIYEINYYRTIPNQARERVGGGIFGNHLSNFTLKFGKKF